MANLGSIGMPGSVAAGAAVTPAGGVSSVSAAAAIVTALPNPLRVNPAATVVPVDAEIVHVPANTKRFGA